jgi:hypothetical protein
VIMQWMPVCIYILAVNSAEVIILCLVSFQLY